GLGLVASLPLSGAVLAQEVVPGPQPIPPIRVPIDVPIDPIPVPIDPIPVPIEDDITPLPDGPIGFLDEKRDAVERERRKGNQFIAFQQPLFPMFRFDKVDHVANGTSLRNRVRGFIQLRGVPLNSKVVQSLLFWNFSNGQAVGPATMDV